MSTDPGCRLRREDAAVALLSREPLPDDVRAHLDACPACRHEIERLTALGPLLAVARDRDVPRAEVPDEALLGRLLTEMARRRSRRRLLVVAAAAAAAVVLAVPIGIWVGDDRPPAEVGATADVLVAEGTAQQPGSPVGADVHVLAHGEGRGSILVIAPWGLKSGVRCRIELVDSTGATSTVQTWTVPAGYTRGWRSRKEVSVAPKEIAGVRLVDDSTGDVLLTVPVEPV